MRLLIDTHVLLGLIRQEPLLPPAFREELAGHRHAYVSVVSLWEVAIKYRLGKLGLGEPPKTLPGLVEDLGFHMLNVTIDQVLAEVEPWPKTQDPFDRLLLAICQVDDMRLLTLDRDLRDHPLAWQPGSA